jgi:hypothetical protein
MTHTITKWLSEISRISDEITKWLSTLLKWLSNIAKWLSEKSRITDKSQNKRALYQTTKYCSKMTDIATKWLSEKSRMTDKIIKWLSTLTHDWAKSLEWLTKSQNWLNTLAKMSERYSQMVYHYSKMVSSNRKMVEYRKVGGLGAATCEVWGLINAGWTWGQLVGSVSCLSWLTDLTDGPMDLSPKMINSLSVCVYIYICMLFIALCDGPMIHHLDQSTSQKNESPDPHEPTPRTRMGRRSRTPACQDRVDASRLSRSTPRDPHDLAIFRSHSDILL